MSKFVSFVKAHVVGPVTVAASAALAPVLAHGGAFDLKATALAFVGALVGAVLHKQVIVRVVGED